MEVQQEVADCLPAFKFSPILSLIVSPFSATDSEDCKVLGSMFIIKLLQIAFQNGNALWFNRFSGSLW